MKKRTATKLKIGLITSHRIPNHGSYLQAWSLSQYLTEKGYDIEIIDYIYPNQYHLNQVQNNEIKRSIDTSSLIKKIKRYVIDRWFVCNRKRGIEYIIYKLLNLAMKNPNKLYFRELKLSQKSYISRKEIQSAKFDYDILLTGSDQIWNPRFTGFDEVFFLQFGNNEVKRVAYSSSFGVISIKSEYQRQYAKWLKSYSYISTREQSGTEIVKNLINKKATHVLDPVMLFDRVRWSEIITSNKYNKRETQPYVVSYCLDYVFSGVIDYADDIMQKIAEKEKLECKTLFKTNLPDYKVETFEETIHPFVFVNTLMNAKFALISSFHGLAFCILFHVPFLVIINSKDNKDSRLSDLLATFNLGERVLIVGDKFKANELKEINWSQVDGVYNTMLLQSERFLKTALDQK